MSFLMVTFALVFPAALRNGKVLYWILGISGLFLFTAGVMIFRNPLRVDSPKDITVEDSLVQDFPPLEDEENSGVGEEWSEDTPEVVLLDHGLEAVDQELDDYQESESTALEEYVKPEESLEVDSPIPIHTKDFSLEELIESGFQAKEQGRYHLAAEWFILALDQKPAYDIAFYLIVETCEHWRNGSSIHDALDKVAPYINEYIKNAPPEWRTQLMEWLATENLPTPREIIGRID